MGYSDRTIKVDVGVRYVDQPCAEHATPRDECRACAEMPPKQVPRHGLEGYWVEVLNPAMLPYGRKQEIYGPEDKGMERLARIFKELCVGWNLEDIASGEPVPIPAQQADALDRVPDVVGPVFEALAVRSAEEALGKDASST